MLSRKFFLGDMNNDNKIDISDVVTLANVAIGNVDPQTHLCSVNAFSSDNADLVGTWGDGVASITFNADGTSSLGFYRFKPQLGRILRLAHAYCGAIARVV